MPEIRVFISSVQAEFSEERRLLCDYIRQDALLGRFFRPFIFEEMPAVNDSAQKAYLTEVEQTDIYLGICGEQYGYEDAEGISPTEREFDRATELSKHRIVFLKRSDNRTIKEQAFVKKIESQVVRKSFADYEGLRSAVYASLVRYMEEKEIIRLLPWDATLHPTASLDDIEDAKVESFVALARKKRHFKMQFTGNNVLDILVSLNLATEDGRLTNAALLLFAKNPQKFFVASIVKCMVFPGTEMTKPILSHQVYGGSLFELVDEATGFVLNHIDASVGTRSKSNSADVTYEIPAEVVAEAIINGCVHRSYESNGSVQVMLFRDRLEVWSPGNLPYGMTVEKLKHKHSSVPVNPILAAPAFLAGYIEHSGTGTTDMMNYCEAAGLRTPEFIQDEDFRVVIWRKTVSGGNVTPNVTPDVTPDVTPVKRVSKALERLKGELTHILSDKYVTAGELAEKYGVDVRTVRRDLDKLRETYDIEWIPLSPTTGYWDVKRKV